MRVYRAAVVAALGTFDGVHLGHRAVLRSAARFKSFTPVCFSFHGTPKAMLGKNIPLILSEYDRGEKIREAGISDVVFFDFDEVKTCPAEIFLEALTEKFNVRAFCCGFNYRFGADGKGDVGLLFDYCNRNGFPFETAEPVKVNGETVSSSRIRDFIKSGDISRANGMLGYPFYFKGEVCRGFGRGRELGFPTANQKILPGLCLPRFGVYASYVYIGGVKYRGVSNIGVNPTFGLPFPGAETHVLDFSGEIYGETIKIEPIAFIRPETRFDSPESLKRRIGEDVKVAKSYFA